ncbi:EAL domain-containing protein [Pseudoalteromonas sp. T1lg122]|uniref:EAL domain-containing protein n=1 Tax=Pseudoalteromonas sp. T1lg122 TaxID=2077094 RepID=UPI000CF63AB4|nr:EAL domain-containing protein [Pseudoalteromonas sp. T1lg122]
MKSAIQHNLIEISETNSSLEYTSRKMDCSEYIFHFKPIVQVTAEGYKMIGAEALIRKVSNGKVILPDAFIEELEASDALAELMKDHILKTAVQLNCILLENDTFKVSFNVPPSMLTHSFVDFIENKFSNCKWLCLEITERTKVTDFTTAKGVIDRLRKLGIDIYLDDVGSGFGDNYYLQEFDITGVKIDKSFTSRIAHGDSKVIDCYIKMYQELGLNIVAEGVETKEQTNALLKRGVHTQQGYYFYKPLPLKKLLMWKQFELIAFKNKQVVNQSQLDKVIKLP